MPPITIFWFRRDLRVEDNHGLYQALRSGFPVLPIFIFDRDILDTLEDRADKRVAFIYQSIQKLQKELAESGTALQVFYGRVEHVFNELVSLYSVSTVITNHDYEPYAIKRDARIERLLTSKGIRFQSFKDQVIFERNEVVKENGSSYSVFTPYAKRWKANLEPEHLSSYDIRPLTSFFLKGQPANLPTLQSMGFKLVPAPGFDPVPEEVIRKYDQTRDIPSIQGTTRLGVQLRFGTISIRRLVKKAMELNQTFLGELIWREFFMQLLWRHPHVEKNCYRPEYEAIQWKNDESEFRRWCRGETGYPLVDAGMRELNETGFMHNRVRMVTASFLVKHLLIDWRWGEAYFAQKLLDYELSSNNGNWQWVAGCGCDAAPYFRLFNPTTQIKRFDPQLLYIKKWVPEWNEVHYSKPMVVHEQARERCLKAYKSALSYTNSAK